MNHSAGTFRLISQKTARPTTNTMLYSTANDTKANHCLLSRCSRRESWWDANGNEREKEGKKAIRVYCLLCCESVGVFLLLSCYIYLSTYISVSTEGLEIFYNSRHMHAHNANGCLTLCKQSCHIDSAKLECHHIFLLFFLLGWLLSFSVFFFARLLSFIFLLFQSMVDSIFHKIFVRFFFLYFCLPPHWVN